jgi:drug/metabolite transporter (DMT)-like permease
MSGRRTALLTVLALIAFAANSWLCRFALREGAIDPWSFTAIRLASGAAVLVPIAAAADPPSGAWSGSWRSALALFAYALAFSLAYVALEAATGALLLFAAVQVTMIGTGWVQGERLGARRWTGMAVAVAGLVLLLGPGWSRPSLAGSACMIVAGISWGIYSLRGRGAADPVASTAGNFLRASAAGALALAVAALGAQAPRLSSAGALLAAASGAITSGLGYVVWYAALRRLTATTAGVAQLAVPAVAALGGVVFLGERPTLAPIACSAAILAGVALAALPEGALRRTRPSISGAS